MSQTLVRHMTFRRPNPVFSDEYRAIREVLVEARRKAGLTQRDLARTLGREYSHIARIEAGQRRIDTLELYRIAKSVRLDPSDLFGRICQRIETSTAESDRER